MQEDLCCGTEVGIVNKVRTAVVTSVLIVLAACSDESLTAVEEPETNAPAVEDLPPTTRELDQGAAISDNDAVEERLAEHARLAEATRAIFDGGLNRTKLENMWDGYPFPTEERDQRIATFFEDFAWIQDDVVIEVNIFEQFANTDFPVPVATVWPEGEPILAIAFNFGGSADDLVIGRIPELGNRELEVLSNQTQTDGSVEITVNVVGVEGSVTAFADGLLPTETNFDDLTTTITVPGELTLSSVITVVTPTPELPAASVIVLE